MSDFFAEYLDFVFTMGDKILNRTGAHRRARGAERRPERGAKRRTGAGAEPLGPSGVPPFDF